MSGATADDPRGFCCDRCGAPWRGEGGWLLGLGDDGLVATVLCPADQSPADQADV